MDAEQLLRTATDPDAKSVTLRRGHKRLETTQLYAQIRPAELKQAVEFYEAKALDMLSS